MLHRKSALLIWPCLALALAVSQAAMAQSDRNGPASLPEGVVVRVQAVAPTGPSQPSDIKPPQAPPQQLMQAPPAPPPAALQAPPPSSSQAAAPAQEPGTPQPPAQRAVTQAPPPLAPPPAPPVAPEKAAPPSAAQSAPEARSPVRARPVTPPSSGGLVQMQFDNIELRDLIRFVSNIMGRNFIYDEAIVKGRVTVLSPRTLSKEEVFRVFESVLNYFGFTIMATPEADKVVRAADAKGMAVETLDRKKFMTLSPEERITTLVYPLHYLDSNAMVGVLRPLMSRDAYLVSVASANALILIDTSANLQRLRTVIEEVDIPVSRQLSGIEVYNVQHTNAADLAEVAASPSRRREEGGDAEREGLHHRLCPVELAAHQRAP